VQARKPQFVDFGAGNKPANPIRRRRPVYLKMGQAWVQVRTFAPEGNDAFVGIVESITADLPAGAGFERGDFVRFEPRHVFSACISHE
jgi:hypothetical protein